MVHSRKWLAGIALALIVALIIVATGIQEQLLLIPTPVSNTPPAATVTKAACDKPPGFILIIADLSGFNNSISHGAPANPWPIVRVEKGQVVRFLVCNLDQTQAHGFAITNYFDSGVPIMPGEAYRIVFTATQAGTFTIYCNIFCTVHVFMRGQLIVTG